MRSAERYLRLGDGRTFELPKTYWAATFVIPVFLADVGCKTAVCRSGASGRLPCKN